MLKTPTRKLLHVVFIMGLTCLIHFAKAQTSPDDFLSLHDAKRATVGQGPVTWDPKLEEYAQRYAEKRSKDCLIVMSNGPYGENVYWGSGEGAIDAEAAVSVWFDEKQWYDYESNTCQPGKDCLHYTQIVWRNSIRLGCATTSCPNDKVFIACNYDPPGNIIGQRPY